MLTPDGFQLRNALASAGYEVTPDELESSLIEAEERVSTGVCKRCGEESTELRYGVCFNCMMKEPETCDTNQEGT